MKEHKLFEMVQVQKYTEDDGQSWVELPKGTIVSMNLWGYNKSILLEIEKGINSFFEIGSKRKSVKV